MTRTRPLSPAGLRRRMRKFAGAIVWLKQVRARSPSSLFIISLFISFPPHFFTTSFCPPLASVPEIVACSGSSHPLIPYNPLADARLCSPLHPEPHFFHFFSSSSPRLIQCAAARRCVHLDGLPVFLGHFGFDLPLTIRRFPDTDRVWASTEEDSTEQATVSSAMGGHRARALLVPPQQGEGGDCWAIRHGEYKRSTDSYAHHDHGARRRHRHSIRIRQAVLCSRSASYDDRPREYDERGFSGIREKGYGKRSGGEVMADRERRRREARCANAMARCLSCYTEGEDGSA
ncbi:hypothetical protein B0H13DRAFT_2682390 [Mycena leptocephala]|nr:hypothetical protein B0H13DRAFT_2682390 [Mycena leptocephala]